MFWTPCLADGPNLEMQSTLEQGACQGIAACSQRLQASGVLSPSTCDLLQAGQQHPHPGLHNDLLAFGHSNMRGAALRGMHFWPLQSLTQDLFAFTWLV